MDARLLFFRWFFGLMVAVGLALIANSTGYSFFAWLSGLATGVTISHLIAHARA